MKKLLLLFALTLGLVSCNPKEEAIKKFMFENLYDYDSYQAIETISYDGIAIHRFRCKTAGGISKLNKWVFYFNDNGTVRSVFDEDKGDFVYLE